MSAEILWGRSVFTGQARGLLRLPPKSMEKYHWRQEGGWLICEKEDRVPNIQDWHGKRQEAKSGRNTQKRAGRREVWEECRESEGQLEWERVKGQSSEGLWRWRWEALTWCQMEEEAAERELKSEELSAEQPERRKIFRAVVWIDWRERQGKVSSSVMKIL